MIPGLIVAHTHVPLIYLFVGPRREKMDASSPTFSSIVSQTVHIAMMNGSRCCPMACTLAGDNPMYFGRGWLQHDLLESKEPLKYYKFQA